MSQTVRYEVIDRIATITLDRPAQLNASTPRPLRRFARRWTGLKTTVKPSSRF